MIERRDFIIRVGSVLISLPILASCGEDKNTPPGQQTASLRFTSSVDGGHSHTVDLSLNELTTDTAVNKTTSNVGEHTHMVALTAMDMATIDGGGTISKETTTDGGHLHTFTFVKATAVTV